MVFWSSGLLAIGLVILLLGVANIDELTGQAVGGEGDVVVGGCGGSEDVEYHAMPLPGMPIGQSRALLGWDDYQETEDTDTQSDDQPTHSDNSGDNAAGNKGNTDDAGDADEVKDDSSCPPAPSGMDLSTQMTFYCDPESPQFCPWHSVCGADPNLDEESYGPTDPKSYKNCCECFYLAQPLCEGTGLWGCWGAHDDCHWRNGQCKTRHHHDCDNWVKARAQKSCHKKVITRLVNVYDKPEPAFKDEKPACTEYRYQYEGHGRNPKNLIEHVSVCLDSLPACGDIYITDTGCSTFQNLAQARLYILELVEQLENEGHQCVRIQANQCLAGNLEQTYYQFSVTKSGICHEGANQCRIGGICYQAEVGESVRCQDGPNGPIIDQTCCAPYLVHVWQKGQSCN